ncbi:hypothetical protein D3C86_2101270 [compost metagenome]
MQNINGTTKTDGINGAIRIRIEVLDHLKNSSASKTLQGFCVRMLRTTLCQIQSMTKNVLYIGGHLLEILLAAANPQE